MKSPATTVSTKAPPMATIPTNKSNTLPASKRSNKPHARRRASGLGGELWGDTGAPALATLDLWRRGDNEKTHLLRRKSRSFPKRRKVKPWPQECKELALQHTWLTPLILLLVILTLYIVNPNPSNPLHRFIFLSYPLASSPAEYAKGPADFAFLAFYTLFLTFTREATMQLLLQPLALFFNITSKSKQLRFMEQTYTALYSSIASISGFLIMSRTPVWYFNISGMYEGFPHRTMTADFKFYYLFQAAYWMQQAVVIGLKLEKPRKDYSQLVGHHIVTLLLIGLSYRFHFTYMGLAVFITHDLADCVFAISKTLHYLDSQWTGPYFVFFIGMWAYLRHYLNWKILISEFYEFKTVGPYKLDWATEQYKCELSHWISTILLGGLQALNLYWGFLILRVAWRFGVKGELADERSEDENEEVDYGDRREVEREISTMIVKARLEETSPATPLRRGGMPKRRAR